MARRREYDPEAEEIFGDYEDDEDYDPSQESESEKVRRQAQLMREIESQLALDPITRDIRQLTRSVYSLQSTRITLGGRLVANYFIRIGVKPGTKGTKESEKANKLLKKLEEDAKMVTDGIAMNIKQLKNLKIEGGFITDDVELVLAMNYLSVKFAEDQTVKILKKALGNVPIFTEFLEHIPGCGPLMSGIIVSYLNPKKADYVTSFWKYVGLDVVEEEDGTFRGRGRYKSHLVMRPYVNAKGQTKEKPSLSYNPRVKSKLVYVLFDNFQKQKNRGNPYYPVYEHYLHRLENRPDLMGDEKPKKAHRLAMARRYMVKIFLMELWLFWRDLEGLQITAPYHEAKLGLSHHEFRANHCLPTPMLPDYFDKINKKIA